MSRSASASRSSKTSSIPRASSRKTSGKKTRSAKRGAKRKSASDGTLADFTRPTPRAERLVPKAFGKIVLAIGAVLVVVSFGNSFVWLPAKSWMGQRDESTGRQIELETLREASEQIQREIDWLKTPAGIEAAARSELGFVKSGEKRKVLIGSTSAPTDLPPGWPYDLVTQIVAVIESEERAAQEPAQ